MHIVAWGALRSGACPSVKQDVPRGALAFCMSMVGRFDAYMPAVEGNWHVQRCCQL